MARPSRRPSASAIDSTEASGVTGSPESDRSRGVRARLAVRDPPTTPIADVLADGVVATNVNRVRIDDSVISEFHTARPIDADPVFEADGEYVYRLRSPASDGPYPCHSIESLGHPVSDVAVRTSPDRILITLSLPSVEPIAEIVDTIESTGASVTLERLTRSGSDAGGDPVVIDRDRLTDRQREVMRTAQRLGYFEYPREADAKEVAAAIDIARSTFAEHLAAAQRQVFDEVFDP